MKIVFHKKYLDVYSNDPAAGEGRLDSSVEELSDVFEFVEPRPATVEDILRVHSPEHIESIKYDMVEYEAALLAAGGAMHTAGLAGGGEPSFGLIRPPGHHASPESCWGFCFCNNMAVSIEHLRAEKGITRVFILDFDLHTGDGNISSFAGDPDVVIFNPPFPGGREGYMDEIVYEIKKMKKQNFDIIASSAGFDTYKEDWGGLLLTEDYNEIGKMLKDLAEEVSNGKRYAILEGGYNYNDLGKNIKAFLNGFD
jgi:acetoin utilization deacetylase AcuC-like enzyme